MQQRYVYLDVGLQIKKNVWLVDLLNIIFMNTSGVCSINIRTSEASISDIVI